jgi:hypothetical protein
MLPDFSDGAAYDPATGSWSAMPKGPLAPCAGPVAAWDGQEAIFWCGANAEGATYDPATGTWRELAPSPLAASGYSDVIWTGGEAIVVAGAQAEAYQPAGGRWQRLPPFPSFTMQAHSEVNGSLNVALTGMTAVWDGTDLLAWATYTVISHRSSGPTGIQLLDQALAWSPGAKAWHALPIVWGHEPLLGATAAWSGEEAFFIGGTSCPPEVPCPYDPYTPVASYTPATGSWGSPPLSRFLEGRGPVVWTGKSLLAIAGASTLGPPGFAVAAGDAGAFQPGLRSWQELAPYPFGTLEGASAAWTGTSLIVWGSSGEGAAHGAVLAPRAAG